jgi:hypothetical protein
MAFTKTTREKLEGQITGLKADRQPYEADWDEISRLTSARATSISKTPGRNRRASNRAMHASGGLLAGRKATNGMYNGLSSSSRPWFKLAPRDRGLLEFGPVKEYFAIVEGMIYDYFNATNYYDTAKVQYNELLHMGGGVTLNLEHREHMSVYYPCLTGSYWLGLDDANRVSTLVRQTNPTVKQLVESVRDRNKITDATMRNYDKGDYSVRVPCMHSIEKNEDALGNPLSRNVRKPWRSIKWEVDQNKTDLLLTEAGFDSQPFTAPRWEVFGDTPYCDTSPGFQALPDLRELQLAAKRGGRAMDGIVKPPMAAPAALSRTGLSFDPGTVTYMEAMAAGNMPQALFTIPWQSIQQIDDKAERLDRRIDELFYADLFMAISDMEGVQPRNEQELLYRNEEKLTQLGPVVDRVNIEKLEVDIDRAHTILKNLGLLPPAPPELDGEPLTVDFISVLAQAQRAAQNTAIERAARFVGFLGATYPDALLKFDAEQAVDEFAQNSGTSPRIIRSDEIIAKMKEQMAAEKQQAQMAQMAPAMAQGAQAAKLLSETQVSPGENALQRVMGQ